MLLDLNVPGARGFSGLLLLRAQFPELPVMIISAVSDADTVRSALELGAAGYLPKSVGPSEIRRAIETVLAGSVFLPAVAALAKAYCSDAYLRVAGENIQIHGGIGFTWEHPAHLYYRRAKSSDLLFGDASHHRELLAQRIGI